MAFAVGMEVYFKGEKHEITNVYKPIGTYELYTNRRNADGFLKRAFRYELTLVTEIETFMNDTEDDLLLSCLSEDQFLEVEAGSRFQSASEASLEQLAQKRNAESTDKQTKWAVRLFKDWLTDSKVDISIEFESLDVFHLNELLRRFYAEARTKSGKSYSKSALVGIRSGLNRHLTSPPFERRLNLMSDKIFMSSNHIMMGLIKEQRREGLDISKHHEPISEGDLKTIYSSGTLSNDNPKALLRKVWFEISYHLGRRGREGLRDLKPQSFVFRHDDTGVEYVEMAYNESDKNHKGLNSREVNKHPRMYASSPNN